MTTTTMTLLLTNDTENDAIDVNYTVSTEQGIEATATKITTTENSDQAIVREMQEIITKLTDMVSSLGELVKTMNDKLFPPNQPETVESTTKITTLNQKNAFFDWDDDDKDNEDGDVEDEDVADAEKQSDAVRACCVDWIVLMSTVPAYYALTWWMLSERCL